MGRRGQAGVWGLLSAWCRAEVAMGGNQAPFVSPHGTVAPGHPHGSL